MNTDKLVRLGFGTMRRLLFSKEDTVKAVQSSLNRTITNLAMLDEGDGRLEITLDDKDILVLSDKARSCCESRYMTCSDKLSFTEYFGAKLVGLEVKEAPEMPCEHDDVHEVQFLEVQTDRGAFQVETHNEHNGYYGGFSIEAEVKSK